MTASTTGWAQAVALLAHQVEPPVLMFDYDGTLAPFVVDRHLARPYPWVADLLTRLRRETLARVVIVSGRPVSDVVRLLPVAPPPEIWGCHGWERRGEDGALVTGKLTRQQRAGLDAGRRWLEEAGLVESMEPKPASLAVHWRGVAAAGQRALEQQIRGAWEPLAQSADLELHPFDGGLELRAGDFSKADAVTTLRGEVPSGAPLGYLGDDLTDEDAFRALGRGDLGILVRQRHRPTAASLWLRPPEELQRFLEELLAAVQARHPRDPSRGGQT